MVNNKIGTFITVFTKAHQLSLYSARCIQSTPNHPISLRSFLILSSFLRLDPPSGLFFSGSQTKILYSFLISPMRATFPTHLILLDTNFPLTLITFPYSLADGFRPI